jgi:hypothetical protein
MPAARSARSTERPIEAGEIAVEHDRIEALAACEGQGIAAVVDLLDGERGLAQPLGKVLAGRRLVLDDQDPHVSSPRSSREDSALVAAVRAERDRRR